MILETERLRLEPFAQQHVTGLHAMDSDPDVMRFIGPVRTLDETREGIGTLATSAQGQGYTTEAGSTAIQFAFEHLGADLVLAIADQKNTASHNVIRWLGMSYRGIETHYDLPLTTYEKYRDAGASVTS